MTDKLQQVLNKVKATPKSGGIYDDLYGESFYEKLPSSWAYASGGPGDGQPGISKDSEGKSFGNSSEKPDANSMYDDDDLFGDSLEEETLRGLGHTMMTWLYQFRT